MTVYPSTSPRTYQRGSDATVQTSHTFFTYNGKECMCCRAVSGRCLWVLKAHLDCVGDEPEAIRAGRTDIRTGVKRIPNDNRRHPCIIASVDSLEIPSALAVGELTCHCSSEEVKSGADF